MAHVARQLAQNIETLFDPDGKVFVLGGRNFSRRGLVQFVFVALLVLVSIFYAVRYIHLDADFDTDIRYTEDGVLYTDEGWYANNAIHYFQSGNWHYPGDLNFAVNLPVLQCLHAISFAVFGLGIHAARLTIIFSLTLLLAFIYLILWRLEDRWTALVGVFLVVANYFFFLYSRLAIAEIPMTLFVVGSLILAWTSRGKRGWVSAFLSGLLASIAVYTKTSAVFCVPLLVGIIFYRNWRAGERPAAFLKLIPSGVAFLAIVLLHSFLLARPYADDFAYFTQLNVSMNLELNVFKILDYYFGLIGRMRLMDENLFLLLQVALIPLLFLSRTFRRNPLVILSILYFVVYTGMYSLYANPRPRYWLPLLVPICILISLIGKHLFIHAQRHWSLKILFFAWLALVAASLIDNTSKLATYFQDIQYTWRDTAMSVKAHMEDDSVENNYLLGHFSTTFALYESEILPINDRYASGPLEERIDRFEPRWLITRDTIYRKDSEEEIMYDYPGSYEERLATLEEHYSQIEEVEVYDTLDSYKGNSLYLYRLTP